MFVPPMSLPRRERERQARRLEMLAAARAVFAEQGYEQATLEAVAEKAEFGKGTLYNYFPGGKEEILTALLTELYDGYAQEVRAHFEALDAPPQAEDFRALFARLISYFTSESETFLLLVKEAQRLLLSMDHASRAQLIELRDRVVSELAGPTQAAIDAGHIRGLPAEAVAHLMMGNLKGYLVAVLSCEDPVGHEGPSFEPDEAADFLATILFDGLRPR